MVASEWSDALIFLTLQVCRSLPSGQVAQKTVLPKQNGDQSSQPYRGHIG
jgi:hypothetical protein